MPQSPSEYHKQAYMWLSIALAMPVLLWPASAFVHLTPAFGTSIEQNWIIAACLLLITAVVADAILSYRHHISHILAVCLWIIITTSVIAATLRDHTMVWFVAALFAIHPLHIAYQLWRYQSKQWWHWLAWWRDSSTACIMFLWLSHWPQ